MIKQITFSDVSFKATKGMTPFQDKGVWFGYYKETILIGVINIIDNHIQSIYVDENYRKLGIGHCLLSFVCEKYQIKLTAKCLITSKKLFLNNGFTIKTHKQYSFGELYVMERRL